MPRDGRPDVSAGVASRVEEALSIRMARGEDIEPFVNHVAAHVMQSGKDGAPYFAMSRKVGRDEIRESAITRWSRRLDEPLWGRSWLLWLDGTGVPRRVVGHIDLRGGRLPAEMHRAVLGMGIERPFTGHGHGGRLLETAISWARDVAGLSWIDLGVFANNAPARKLYARAGFVEVGVREDAFRVDDRVSVDDIQMTLALRLTP